MRILLYSLLCIEGGEMGDLHIFPIEFFHIFKPSQTETENETKTTEIHENISKTISYVTWQNMTGRVVCTKGKWGNTQ